MHVFIVGRGFRFRFVSFRFVSFPVPAFITCPIALRRSVWLHRIVTVNSQLTTYDNKETPKPA